MPKRCTRCQKELTSGQIICLECANKLKAKPTLEEVLKEWEEKGYIVNNNKFSIFLHHEQHSLSLFINKEEKKYHIYYGYISLELNELLSKTLKALEVENG